MNRATVTWQRNSGILLRKMDERETPLKVYGNLKLSTKYRKVVLMDVLLAQTLLKIGIRRMHQVTLIERTLTFSVVRFNEFGRNLLKC